MRSFIIMLTGLCSAGYTYAQSTAVFRLRDEKTKAPLIGATCNIEGAAIGNSADTGGVARLIGIPAGRQIVHSRAIGYSDRYDTLIFPLQHDTVDVTLNADEEEMEAVVVSSTRSSRNIQAIPTRIEVIGLDELGEKGNMKPGDIRMVLSESTGIQVVQTSATSGNAGIRIEGLDGRYTQVLKDGFPLYAGFSGGLGLLQTPPLDLKRVEIIKGASSTLYGGGAIAGLVNLISKTPADNRELNFLLNGTSAKGLDINGFYSQRYGKAGLTLYAAYNMNDAYAPGSTIFTAIPRFSRYTLAPKLFLYPSAKTTISVGLNAAVEDRLGGDIYYIHGERGNMHSYAQQNNTTRLSSQAELKHKTGDNELTFRNSVCYFDRTIHIPQYIFSGHQTNTFTEGSYNFTQKNMEWVVGGNLITESFKEVAHTTLPLRNYQLTTIGIFVQNTWDISKKLVMESGLRGDYVTQYGAVVLPRLSLLYKPNASVSSRLGGGLGYKAPTIFTEDAERLDYRNVLPVTPAQNTLEHSYGGNWDVNYKTTFANGAVRFSVNQLFFYTHLRSPLQLIWVPAGYYQLQNAAAHLDATGSETNVKFSYRHFTLFMGYTYTHSHLHFAGNITETPLTPRHHTNSVLMYEFEGKFKIGAEAYYYSTQQLSNGLRGHDYWLCGLMAEKTWKHFSLFINFENILNVRQTNFGPIYTGSISDPQFSEVYAPLDGFVMNGGIKLRL